MVDGDQERIEQVIMNIVSNSIKYTADGGIISMTAGTTGKYVYVKVSDNGVGIPEKDLPRLFERFYRVDKARSRAAGGTGLGLSIVSDTVKQRGGTVEAANRPGGGAVFTVRWPAVKGGGAV